MSLRVLIHESAARSPLLLGSFPLNKSTLVCVFIPLVKDLWDVLRLELFE